MRPIDSEAPSLLLETQETRLGRTASSTASAGHNQMTSVSEHFVAHIADPS